jgi:hypothetical protein
MGEILLRAIPLGIKPDGAELERGVAGEAKLPVCREPLGAGILQVAIRDGEKFGDLRGCRAVRAQPAVLRPGFQAHRVLL